MGGGRQERERKGGKKEEREVRRSKRRINSVYEVQEGKECRMIDRFLTRTDL